MVVVVVVVVVVVEGEGEGEGVAGVEVCVKAEEGGSGRGEADEGGGERVEQTEGRRGVVAGEEVEGVRRWEVVEEEEVDGGGCEEDSEEGTAGWRLNGGFFC